MNTLATILSPPRPHWVGDGFPVRTLFSYASLGSRISPFLLLDYAGPHAFPAATGRRGVGAHPHRGFETVTLVYQGELEHRDSTGAGGRIGPGDVQWMTAGAGIVHEEFHADAFTRAGGTLQMVQLWVNLPARDKSAPAGYQSLQASDIPRVALPGGAGHLRVIAGEYAGLQGPARTFSPMDVWDLQLGAGKAAELPRRAGHQVAVAVLSGTLMVDDSGPLRDGQVALLAEGADRIAIEANNEALVLLLGGQPLGEPIVGHGPFVMNTVDQIDEAIADFQQGRFGRMPA
jgi:redox-sensitive bicupin YhaK (pirin superfamily)